MLWVLKRTVSLRRFFCAPKTYAKNYWQENINNFTLNIFVYPNLWFAYFAGLAYIVKQDPEILKLRIEIMMKENCEEFALNLCTWSLKHPQLKNDLKIKEHQIVIMYKQQMFAKMQEVVSVCSSVGLVRQIWK